MFQYAISDCSGRKLTLGEAISEGPLSKLWNVLRKLLKKSFLTFVVPAVSLIPESLSDCGILV